jgi:hypothetical protein
MDACKINVFDEDDSYIDRIEQTKRDKAVRNSIYRAGQHLVPLKPLQSLKKPHFYAQKENKLTHSNTFNQHNYCYS